MIAEGRLDQMLTVGKEHLVETLSPTHTLLPGRLKRHGLLVKELRRRIANTNAVNSAERGELNILGQRMELPAVHALNNASRDKVARTRYGAGRLADVARVVEKTRLAQIPSGIRCRDPRASEVLGVTIARDHMEALVKGIIHLGHVIAGDNIIGIEDKVTFKGVGILVKDTVETKVHDPALAFTGQVVSLVHDSARLARELRGVIGAGIGDDKDLDELGRIILVLDGANEVGDNGLLVVCCNKEGIPVELFGLGRRDLAAESTDDKEDHLVQEADREQRDDNLVEDHDGCVGL